MGEKILTIITSVYKPLFFEDFVEDTLRQTIFDECRWEILEVGVKEKSYKKTLPKNVNYKISNNRISVYEAWNDIIQRSETPYLANYNVDDRSAANHLERLVDTLDIYDDVSMVYCPNLETKKPNETFEKNSAGGRGFPCHSFDPQTYWRNNSAHARPVWRSNLHEKYGYFNEKYQICADYEFWLRCIHNGEKFYKVGASPLYLYHRSNVGVSSSKEGVRDAMGEIRKIRQKYGYMK